MGENLNEPVGKELSRREQDSLVRRWMAGLERSLDRKLREQEEERRRRAEAAAVEAGLNQRRTG